MFHVRTLLAMATLIATLPFTGTLAWAADGIINKTPDATGQYCHLRFPAIREDTLYSDRPMLKDAGSGDIVDIYAPCDYDPLGKEEVARQIAHRRHIRDHHLFSD